MKYPVRITLAAKRDLEDIFDWVAQNDSPAKANYVLNRLVASANSIAALPGRGSRPSELPPGLKMDYRQVFFKPFRVIYSVTRTEVVIHLVADGRRNLQSLLLQRLTSQ
ncbi:MAG: type II toxin-antitoxin system RelE/ParE family toxin [Terracidiphilus sp.]